MNELARLRGSERYGACDDEGKEPHRAHPPGTSAGRTAGTLLIEIGGEIVSNTVFIRADKGDLPIIFFTQGFHKNRNRFPGIQ